MFFLVYTYAVRCQQLNAGVLCNDMHHHVHTLTQALLDIDGKGGTTSDEFLSVAKACMVAEKAAAQGAGGDSETRAGLDALQSHVMRHTVSVLVLVVLSGGVLRCTASSAAAKSVSV